MLSVIIFRYLVQQISRSAALTLMVLLMIFIANQLIYSMADVAGGKLTLDAVLKVAIIQVPMLIGYLLPLSLFIALLTTLGRMHADNERVVLAACGLHPRTFLRHICMIASLFFVLDLALMFYLEPLMFKKRTDIVVRSANTATLKKILPRRFQSLGGTNGALYVSEFDPHSKGSFNDVILVMPDASRHPVREAQRWQLLSAHKISERILPDGGRIFHFDKGRQYTGYPGSADYQVMEFSGYHLALTPQGISTHERYSAMSSVSLIASWLRNDLRAYTELQWRLSVALSTLAFAFLALPLSRVSPRSGKFARLLPAVLIYIFYVNLMFASKVWLKQGVTPTALGLWWLPALLSVVAGLIAVRWAALLRYGRYGLVRRRC